MPENDEALRQALTQLAAESDDNIRFTVLDTRQLGGRINARLKNSRNPIYYFEVTGPDGVAFDAVAYTLLLNGPARPSTRAEALGQALAADEGKLFRHNPFLLIYDYLGNQFLAVSAASLFGAFADEMGRRDIAPADSALFSLTPSFAKRTVSMYQTLGEPTVWHCSLSDGELTQASLMAGLDRIRGETLAAGPRLPFIITAIRDRVNAKTQPAVGEPAADGPLLAMLPLPMARPEGLDLEDEAEEGLLISPRIWRMILTAIQSAPAVILVGPPGTGKTALLRKAISELSRSPAFNEADERLPEPLWATPDESWTSRELVGGDTVSDGEIRFRNGWVLRAVAENRWLILDEANRGDMDRIFGGLLTWLAGGKVSVGMESTADSAKIIELAWKVGNCEVQTSETNIRYLAGDKWRLLGTYNALDAQRVFRFGAALGRRFLRVPIPAIEPQLFAEALARKADGVPAALRARLQKLYEAHFKSEATCLGPALFLAMCQYLRVAVKDGAIEGDIEDPATQEVGDGSPGEDVQDPKSQEDVGTGPTDIAEDLARGADLASDAAASPSYSDILAEAYVTHVGTWLAHLDPREFSSLRDRVLEGGALTDSGWSWISTMILALA